jgi:hypothetical protein
MMQANRFTVEIRFMGKNQDQWRARATVSSTPRR